MRSTEAGLSDNDIASVMRIRRRVAAEDKSVVSSKQRLRLFQLCEDLQKELNEIVTSKVVASDASDEEAAQKSESSKPKSAKARRKAS